MSDSFFGRYKPFRWEPKPDAEREADKDDAAEQRREEEADDMRQERGGDPDD